MLLVIFGLVVVLVVRVDDLVRLGLSEPCWCCNGAMCKGTALAVAAEDHQFGKLDGMAGQ